VNTSKSGEISGSQCGEYEIALMMEAASIPETSVNF
jgi:hypothetical protein